MPRRKTTATQATQARSDVEEDFDENLEDADDVGEVDGGHRQKGGAGRRSGGGATSLSSEDIEKKANDLCRLALFSEFRRQILKREEINKKIMGGNNKSFPLVLERANKRLKNALGYEIVELMSRGEREKTQTGQKDADEEPKKKASSKQYIVRNTLDPELIRLACAPDADIRQQEEEDALDEDERFTGSIINWQTADQIPAYGILFVILSLILVNGKALADATLRSYLKKLRLLSSSQVEVGTAKAPKTITFEQYLTMLIKQGWLDRIVVGNTGGAKGAKRRRQDGEDGTVDLEWRWGERAQAQISEQDMGNFVVDFMVERNTLGDQPENERERASRLEKLKKQLTRDVKKAAQSPLTIIENAAHDGEQGAHA